MRRLLKRIAVVAALVAVVGYFAWRYWELWERRAAARMARESAAQLDARLDRVLSLDVQDVPLRKVLAQLAREQGVTIDVDATALANVGIKRDPPVTIALRDVTLREALGRIANSFDKPLVAVPRSGRVLVTTPLEAEDDVILEVYPLPPHMTGASGVTEEQFHDLVAKFYAPEVYELASQRSLYRNNLARPAGAITYSGPAAVEAFPGGLAVVQTPEVHREIQKLLAALEEVDLNPDRLAPIDLDPPSAEEQRIERVLAQPAAIDAKNMRLDQAADELSMRYGIPIRVDRVLVNDHALGSWGEPITLNGVSLRTILQVIARSAEAVIDVHDDAAWFMSGEAVEEELRSVRVYPCGDLLAPHGGYRIGQLNDIITSTVAPTSWDDVGGKCGLGACGHALVIVADDSVHREVEQLLSMLRRHAAGEEPISPPAGNLAKLEAALARNVTVEYVDKPIGDVFRELSAEFDMPIEVHCEALDTAGVTRSTPVTYRAQDRPLAAVLNDMLAQLELSWMIIDDELILVTTPENLEVHLRTVVYDVRHLTSPDFGRPDYESLIDLITCIIEPTSWTDVGGTGQILEGDGCIVIGQTDVAHREIGLLLDALSRQMDEPERFEPIELASLAPEQDRAVQAKLERNVTLTIEKQSLEAFAAWLADEFDLPVQFGAAMFQEADPDGVFPADYVRSITIQDAPLKSALRTVLRQYECNYIVRDGALMITRDEEIESDLVARVYNVADLVATPKGWTYSPFHRSNADFMTLFNLLASIIAPKSWADTGGVGAMQEFVTPYCKTLALSQTPEVFEKIDRLLAEVRHLREPGRFPAPPRLPSEERIEKILNAPTDLVFKETPLIDVAAALSDQWGVPVIADAPPEYYPYSITCEVRGLPAREALVQVLDGQGLDIAVDGDAILITGRDIAASQFGEVRTYPWKPETGGGAIATDDAAMLDLLTSLVDPAGWTDSGGGGDVVTFGDVVAVRQRLAVQPEVAAFFEFLKSTKGLDIPTARFDEPLSATQRDWVVEHLRGGTDDWNTRYAAHVAGKSKAHADEFVPGLIDLLKRSDPVRHAALHEIVVVALGNFGRQAAGAAETLERQIDAAINRDRRRRYLGLLTVMGTHSAPKLTELLINDEDLRRLATDALISFGPEARDQVPVIIQAIVDGKFSWYWQVSNGSRRPQLTLGNGEHPITELLGALDPGFTETRRAIDTFLNGGDPQVRERAAMLSQVIDDAMVVEPLEGEESE